MSLQLSLGKFQMFAELPAEKYEALKADIAKNGVLVPVEIDQHGQVLDGNHRIRAWTELRSEGVMQEVVSLVEMMASQGDEQAERSIRALAVDGVRTLVSRVVKKQQGQVRIAKTGKVVGISARVGSRSRDKDGTQLRTYQQTLWYEMSWDDFAAMVASRFEHIAQLTDKAMVFQGILRYRDLHPETGTPIEAFTLEGIDPRAFNIDLAA